MVSVSVALPVPPRWSRSVSLSRFLPPLSVSPRSTPSRC